MMAALPFNGNQLFNEVSRGEITADSLVSEIDTGIGEGIVGVAKLVSLMSRISMIFGAILLILAIVFLVRTIKNKKKLDGEFSEIVIKSVANNAVALLVINILLAYGSFFALILVIMSIVSIVFSNKAKKLLIENVEQAKAKARSANIINIVVSAIMIVSALLSVFLGSMLWPIIISTINISTAIF